MFMGEVYMSLERYDSCQEVQHAAIKEVSKVLERCVS